MQTDTTEGFRLSSQQRRLWFTQEPLQNQPHRTQCLLMIEEPLNVQLLHQALNDVVAQHEILRTTFNYLPGITIPLQFLAETAFTPLPHVDLSGLHSQEQAASIEALFHEVNLLHFDFTTGPLFHAFLLRKSIHKHLLLLAASALCADAETLKTLAQEITCAYQACLLKQIYTSETMQYVDYSEWQNELLEEESAETRKTYWQKINWWRTASVHFPFEHACHHAQQHFIPHVLAITLPSATSVSLLSHQDADVSPEAFLLACWQILLWRFTAQPDLTIGVACNGRHYEELSTATGPFTRFVPVQSSFEPTASFTQALKQATTSLAKANEYQDYFTWDAPSIVQAETEHLPSLDVTFEWFDWQSAQGTDSTIFSLQKIFSCTERYILKLAATQMGQGLRLELHYDPQHLPAMQVRYLANSFSTLLQCALAQPGTQVSRLELLEGHERQRLLQLGIGATTDYPHHRLLHQLFEVQAERRPDEPAVVCDGACLTFRQLNQQANRLAHMLRQHGVRPNVLVGLCLERSAVMLVGLLGILKAGGAYVPLDSDTPAARLAHQLQEIQAPLVLTQASIMPHLPETGGPYLCLDDPAWLMNAPDTNLSALSGSEDAAYVMYTSGSSGKPKGVIIQQRSVLNYICALSDILKVQPGLHFATVSTLAADLGNTVIFSSLVSGGCLHVLSYATLTSGQAMAHYMREHPIDVLKIVPSHLSSLLTATETAELLPRHTLVLGGEPFSRTLLTQLQAVDSKCCIINHYGPTETTIGVLTHVPGHDEDIQTAVTVPIGKPIANAEVYILDAHQQIVPFGVVGELYVGGDGLAMGYAQQPEQTATSFVPHPFHNKQGARLYRTGDLARYMAKGEVLFIGRADRQVKIRGYRIELGEIEAALHRHPNVRAAIVLPRGDEPGNRRLIGYVVGKQPGLTDTELHHFLEEQVPEYMIPSLFVLLDAMPLTANGKVDREKLPEPQQSENASPSSPAVPRSPLEEMLVELWKEVLQVQRLGVHDNFFRLGGHSLLATQVISRLRAMLHIEVPLRSLFEAPTIVQLLPRIEQALRGGFEETVPPLLPVSREGEVPLSFAQQRLWFLDQLEPGSTAYNILVATKLCGVLNVEALERSLGEIVRRHELLRTTFHLHDGHAVQIMEKARAFHLPVAELCLLSSPQREAECETLAQQEFQRPFHLAQGPLLRVLLLRLHSDEHVLLLSMHHIISDGWSGSIFMQELKSLYIAFSQGKPSPLAPLPIQYADFACWQRQWLQGQALEAQLDYWIRQLTGIVPLELPTDQPRQAAQSQQGAHESLLFPHSLSKALKALSQRQNATLFMTLLAAFQALLARYTSQTDISVGTPIANRTHPAIEGLIGFFVNTLVIRTNLTGNPSFLELVERVREVALGAYAHQDLPFESLVEALQPERDLSRSPLFQVLFILQHIPHLDEEMAGVRLDHLEPVANAARYDLTLSILDTDQGLRCTFEYCTALFKKSTIQRLLAHWQTLLTGIVERPELRLSELPLLTQTDQQLLQTWNDTSHSEPEQRPIHQLIEEQATYTPEAIAVRCGEDQVSYHWLNTHANWLAHLLVQKGIGPEVRVAVLAERSIPFLGAILAIFKAGGVYLPLDPLHPHSRLLQVLQQSQSPLILVDTVCYPTLMRTLENIPPEERPATIPLEGFIAEHTAPNLPNRIDIHYMAYVIYTSGSTGTPKGVMVEHGGMLNHIAAKIADVQLSARDTLAQNGPQCFDISVWQSLAPLLLGGCVEVIPDEIALDATRLLTVVDERGVSVLQLVPSMLRALITEIAVQTCQPALPALRWLVPTGDALPADTCRTWLKLYPAIPLLNTYGSTECSDDQCHFPIHNTLPDEYWTPIMPIGTPIAHMRAYILDQTLTQVPPGVIGELYIGGFGVGRGYLNEPERTASVFLPDPWDRQFGGRLYKTGDIARRLENGAIEFLGRKDHMVKVRGYRIELHEIEAALTHSDQVSDCVVVIREGKEGDKQLLAYVVPNRPSITTYDLRSYLEQKLPAYMIPSAFLLLEALPLTPNGKLDRRGLPEPDPSHFTRSTHPATVSSPLQEVIATIYADILKLEHVGTNENFFELGGHSLLATQVISRIRTLLHNELPLRSLFESPTVAGLAEQVEKLRHGQPQKIAIPIVPVPNIDNLPLSFAQQRLWFLDQLEPGDPLYNIATAVQLDGKLYVRELESSLREIVRRHESLRTMFHMTEKHPVQVIGNGDTFRLLRFDLCNLLLEQQQREAQRLTQEEAGRSFDLSRGPLLRASLLCLHENKHILQLTMHHIVSDGWSMDILVRELCSLYTAFVQAKPSPLPDLPIRYADFASWQRQWLQGEALQAQLDYWKKQLSGVTPLSLPTDRPRTGKPGSSGARYSFTVPADLTRALGMLSRQEGVTLFMTLLAAFQVLLYRSTGQSDVVVGTDIANRTRIETEGLIGFFVNLLVLRTDLSDNPSFRKTLHLVRHMVLESYASQDLPFDMLIEHLHIERNADQVPLVHTLFVLQNVPQSQVQLPGLTLSPFEIEATSSKFDLAVFLTPGPEGLRGLVQYRADLFEKQTIIALLTRFEMLLASIVLQPDAFVNTIEIYTEADKAQMEREKQTRRESRQKKLQTSKRNDFEIHR